MLAVGVDLDHDVVPVAHGVAVADAHRAADAEVEREPADEAPAARATSAVASTEPSSTTRTSATG